MSNPEPSTERLLETFLALLRVDSYFGDEDRVVAVLTELLEPAEVDFKRDAIGNLIGMWPGRESDAAPIMLNAHMDTVQSTAGLKLVVDEEGVGTDGSTILGADNKSGVAAIVEAVLAVEGSGAAHGPVDLVFTIGEDVGHVGSKAFAPESIAATVGFVLDAGSPVGDVVTEAPGTRRLQADFHGRAAHAGIEPEAGVSAISIMSRAIANMPLGRIDAGTVANIGTITGGQALNIVAPYARLEAQARSLSEERLDAQMAAMCAAMNEAAEHYAGSVDYAVEPFVRAYQLGDDDPALVRAEAAIRAAGLTPNRISTGGGSDAHEFNAKGMNTVCMGAGYRDAHAVTEFMPHDELRRLTEVTIQLVLGA